MRVPNDADPADKAEIYRQLGLTLTYHPNEKRVVAEARPAFTTRPTFPRRQVTPPPRIRAHLPIERAHRAGQSVAGATSRSGPAATGVAELESARRASAHLGCHLAAVELVVMYRSRTVPLAQHRDARPRRNRATRELWGFCGGRSLAVRYEAALHFAIIGEWLRPLAIQTSSRSSGYNARRTQNSRSAANGSSVTPVSTSKIIVARRPLP